MPGGKIDAGESAKQALCREIAEELNVSITENDLKYYTHITAPAYGENNGAIMEQDCFFVNKEIEANPSAEIGDIRYFTLAEYLDQTNKTPGAIRILELLKANGFID